MEDSTQQKIIEAEKTDKEYLTRKDNNRKHKEKQITERKPKKEDTFKIHQKQINTQMFFHNSLIGIHEEVSLEDIQHNKIFQNALNKTPSKLTLKKIKKLQHNISIAKNYTAIKQNQQLRQEQQNVDSTLRDMKYITFRQYVPNQQK